MPTIKAPRLARSKTTDQGGAESARGTSPQLSTNTTFKASYNDLRSPDGRQKLREQLTSQFPESYASSLKASPGVPEMTGRDYLSVGQNAAAKSSTSSVDSTHNGPKRLSSVAGNSQAVDVEQAIHLLTELKKTATPEQLVALHKALLPTRDSIISTADSSAGQWTSLVRQKSLLPAGLATRGGASEDLLKRQEDVQPMNKSRRSSRSEEHRRLQSKNSIAALDLADDATNPVWGHRTATPSYDQQYFGAYRPGTLRITNGTASPEPYGGPNTGGGADNEVAPQPVDINWDRTQHIADETCVASSMYEGSSSDTKQRARSVGPPTTSSTQPRPSSRGPLLYRSKRSQEPIQANTPSTVSRESSLSRLPMHVETRASQQSLAASKKASTDTFARRGSFEMSLRGLDSVRHSIDDGRVSPIDAPRFVQRWSHRASQISQEYASDSEVPASPSDDKGFALRLSTVYDRDDAENTANETPEAALHKLEANSVPLEDPRDRSSDEQTPRNSKHSEERKSLKATAEGLNNTTRPALLSTQSEPRPMPSKADSGYVSDASHRSLQRHLSHEPSAEYAESPATYEHSQSGFQEIIHRTDPDADDIQSLYTLEQILKMPSLLSSSSTPPRLDTARKHSSFMKLTGLKKSPLSASKTTLDARASADSLPLAIESGDSSPVETKAVKPAKKLQKRMPDDLRRRQRLLREKERQSLLNLPDRDSDGMEVPFDLSELAGSPAPVSELATASRTSLSASHMTSRMESTPAEALSELVGDSQHPVELETDESISTLTRSLSSQTSKKSRRRSRRNTVIEPQVEAKAESTRKRSFSLGRKRSKSKRRSGSLTPKRQSNEIPPVPSIAALSASWSEHGSRESLPLYSDYGSVARTLGSNPYDISTGMTKKQNGPQPVLDQLQSPHQITSFFSRTSTRGLSGMDASMASELARMKSRDVAIRNEREVDDRLRMAIPVKRSQEDLMRFRNTLPNALKVEQRSPGWRGTAIFHGHKPSFENLQSRQRPYSMAESFSTVPEMPADAKARAAKASEHLTKRTKKQEEPLVMVESSRPSSLPAPPCADQPGFSNESVADAVAKAVEARRAKHAERVKRDKKADRLRPVYQRTNSENSSSTGRVSLQIHNIDDRPYPDASTSVVIGVGSERGDQEDRGSTVRGVEEEQGQPSVWERQAKIWRDRRQSIGESLRKPVEVGNASVAVRPTTSPPLLPPQEATPSAREDLPSARRRRASASEQANAYRDLIGSEHDRFEDVPPMPDWYPGSTESDATIDTVVFEKALPVKAYQATLINRERSAGGRVRTPSGSYHPYSPDHAAEAERSRSNSLAQLEGEEKPSSKFLEANRRSHQHADTLKSTVSRNDRALSPVLASEAGSITDSSRTSMNASRGEPLVDRYGGGLQYGYERGVGVQGSSGLRTSMVAGPAAPRNGNKFSEHYGLDLGDVPVFLRRAGQGR